MAPGPEMSDTQLDELDRSRRVLFPGLVRAVLSSTVILVAYFVLPLDRLADLTPFVSLPAALALFVLLLVAQLRAISRSAVPGVRAIEALATSVPLLVVIFAGTYYVMGVTSPDWFSEGLSKLDSLYFAVTVFATVGFGDITATAPGSRAAVTVQMAVDLLVIGIGLRVILGAVQAARHRSGQRPPAVDP